jgi:hypothetical protein
MIDVAQQLERPSTDIWPALPLDAWRETYVTLHMWTQIVGKVRLALTPLVNHWWNVPLYVTARGLGTAAMPYGDRDIEIAFDFIDHNLTIDSSDGRRKVLPLVARSVANFYREVMASLEALDVQVHIWPKPVEVSEAIPFDQDEKHASYDPEYAHRVWRILVETEQVFQEFRTRFLGKCSPVHFFWGSFDLAVTRFSGRRAPERPNADRITREAYSHEAISHGFWPGGSWFGTEVKDPVFYSYTVPEPPGLRDEAIRPSGAFYDPRLSEFILPYDYVRSASSPRNTLLEFMQSTYQAGASRAAWDRSALERESPVQSPVQTYA